MSYTKEALFDKELESNKELDYQYHEFQAHVDRSIELLDQAIEVSGDLLNQLRTMFPENKDLDEDVTDEGREIDQHYQEMRIPEPQPYN